MKNEIIMEKVCLSKSELGKNILSGIMPQATRDDGIKKEFTVRVAGPKTDINYLHYLTSDSKYFNDHIDIDGSAFTLLYDLKVERPIDNIYFGVFTGCSGQYAIGKFEIYAGNDKESLFFNKENCIISVDNTNSAAFPIVNDRSTVNFLTPGLKCRYIALRQLTTADKEPVSRIRNFGAFNANFSKQATYIDNNYKGSISNGLVPDIKGKVSGNPEMLTDSMVFDDLTAVVLNNGEVIFNLPAKKPIDHIVIISDKMPSVKCDFGYGETDAPFTTEPTSDGRKVFNLAIGRSKPTDKVTLKFEGTVKLDQVMLFSEQRDIKVALDDVITEDFVGLGADVIPTHLFEGSRKEGFNEAFMALETRRVITAKPAVARLWFQVDWFIMDENDYMAGKGTFNTPKMLAVYKELDALKAAGTEVELNFGWKAGFAIQSWFSFPDVHVRRSSAPRNLDGFAASCSACLRELIINRGYDNIKYLNFFNVCNGGVPNGWDFLCPEGYDIKAYWGQMVMKVRNKLKEDGIGDIVKLWIAETSGPCDSVEDNSIGEWLRYFNKNYADEYECATFHQYGATYSQAYENAKIACRLAGKHPACIMEFGTYDCPEYVTNDFDFEHNNIATVMGYINGGLRALAYWILSGALVDESFFHDDMQAAFWRSPINGNKVNINGATKAFYELSLITNYLPRHSSVVKTIVSDTGIHAIAVKTANGDYTVAADFETTHFGKQLSINLGKNINKKFYKHVYKLGTKLEGNLVIPPCAGEYDVKDTITDTIDADYTFVLYTTIKPREQVVIDKLYSIVAPGESIKLNAKTIDGNSKIKWSICDTLTSTGQKGSVTEDGVYTADSRYYKNYGLYGMETTIALKAEAESGEYGIAIVRVQM